MAPSGGSTPRSSQPGVPALRSNDLSVAFFCREARTHRNWPLSRATAPAAPHRRPGPRQTFASSHRSPPATASRAQPPAQRAAFAHLHAVPFSALSPRAHASVHASPIAAARVPRASTTPPRSRAKPRAPPRRSPRLSPTPVPARRRHSPPERPDVRRTVRASVCLPDATQASAGGCRAGERAWPGWPARQKQTGQDLSRPASCASYDAPHVIPCTPC